MKFKKNKIIEGSKTWRGRIWKSREVYRTFFCIIHLDFLWRLWFYARLWIELKREVRDVIGQ